VFPRSWVTRKGFRFGTCRRLIVDVKWLGRDSKIAFQRVPKVKEF
jgi:hypothetical protein